MYLYIYIYTYMHIYVYIYIYMYIYIYIYIMSRVFANGPGDRGSISGRVISKTQKMVLDAALLSTQHYKGSGVKWSHSGNGEAPLPTLWCSSY